MPRTLPLRREPIRSRQHGPSRSGFLIRGSLATRFRNLALVRPKGETARETFREYPKKPGAWKVTLKLRIS
jgi:hypothetical protein